MNTLQAIGLFALAVVASESGCADSVFEASGLDEAVRAEVRIFDGLTREERIFSTDNARYLESLVSVLDHLENRHLSTSAFPDRESGLPRVLLRIDDDQGKWLGIDLSGGYLCLNSSGGVGVYGQEEGDAQVRKLREAIVSIGNVEGALKRIVPYEPPVVKESTSVQDRAEAIDPFAPVESSGKSRKPEQGD